MEKENKKIKSDKKISIKTNLNRNRTNIVSYEAIKNDEEINIYIEMGNETLVQLGYTEHSKAHASKVAKLAADIAKIVNAIGQHDEKTGTPVDAISAAEILGMKFKMTANGSKIC